MTIRYLATALACQLVLAVSAGAADHCVRSVAPAGGDGSDWARAWRQLPASLVRGDTYYVAEGDYSAYTFDDPPSGDKYITIRKATQEDHGTDTGWQEAFGDGQAVFDPLWFATDYWKFDGVTGAGKNGPSYGFRVARASYQGVGRSQLITIHGPAREALSFIEIRHAEVPNGGPQYDIPQYNIYALGGSNITVSDNYIYNGSANLIIRGWKNCLIERNYFGDNWSSSNNHGEQISPGGGCEDVVLRYNVFANSSVYAVGFHKADNRRWKVTGNIVVGGTVAAAFGNADSSSENVIMDSEFHNNTFVRVHGIGYGSGIFIGTGSGNTAYNNLWYKCIYPLLNTVNTHDYNSFLDCTWLGGAGPPEEPHVQIGSGDPFVDSANGDFHLTGPSAPGKDGLGPPHDKDMDGRTRGADGNWDRGALEYVAGIIAADGWQVVARHGQVDLATPMADGYVEPSSRGLRRFRVVFTAALDPATVSKAVVTIVGDTSGDQAALIDTVVLEGDRTLSVTLSAPLPDADRYTVTISPALHRTGGQAVTGDLDLRLAVLAGDVDGSGAVGAADILAVRDRANQSVEATTARYDVDHSGAITSNDMKTVRERSGRQLP